FARGSAARCSLMLPLRVVKLSVASAMQWVGVDALRPKPEINALPKKLGVHGEHLSRLGPSYDQFTPGCRVTLVLGYRGSLPPGLQRPPCGGGVRGFRKGLPPPPGPRFFRHHE